MTIKIKNTFSNQKEEFKPQNDKQVSMYVCGITPYDETHLGHARSYIAFDIIKRHLLKRGYTVRHVQNFTDVDDKIIIRSQEKNISVKDLVKIYIDDYFTQMDKLNILRAEKYPCVTDVVSDMINFIEELIKKGFAYEVGGDVYFAVEKFKNYGMLSKRNIKELMAGVRVKMSNEKISPCDFVLWKKAKEHEPKEIIWDSPWSRGRPGWHIECSVMASKFLDDTIDIHGGGQDLMFPHHENEIAQSEARNGKQFVKYWVHNGFVTINKEKMSKSLNNFFTLRAILEEYDPRVVRYYLLTQHYSRPLNFSDYDLKAAKSSLQGLDNAYLRLVSVIDNFGLKIEIKDKDLLSLQESFLSALDDDFNSEKALSYLHELKNIILKEIHTASQGRLVQMERLLKDFSETSLGITLPKAQDLSESVYNILEERTKARENKNWQESDRLRKIIEEKGYKVVDNRDGTSVLTKKI